MITAVDTNVLLDVFTGSPAATAEAFAALSRAIHAGSITTSFVCYAELARRFPDKDELDGFLLNVECIVTPLDTNIAFLAGRFFNEYRSRGGEKTRILADFLIAADAALNADRILTYDKRFFGGQFPGLTAVTYEDL